MNPWAIPMAIGIGPSFRDKLRGIISMLTQDSSIYKFQRTLFLKLGSHYPPLCGIVRLTNFNTPIVPS